jgi:hypothetical protein
LVVPRARPVRTARAPVRPARRMSASVLL